MESQGSSGKIAVWVIIALIIGGVVGFFAAKGRYQSSYKEVSEAGQNMPASARQPSGISDKQLALNQAMRKLWTDHVVWTREYIVAAVNGAPDTQAAATRLLQNQADIGNAIVPYYGQAAGDQLAGLLKQHILLAVDLINDLKNNDQAKFKTDDDKWKANANDIADFLASANPNWPKQDLEDMMADHLAVTTQEVADYFGKKYDMDVKDFDTVLNHMLMMSDALSGGIIKQFPGKF